jgi:hypothetical protein
MKKIKLSEERKRIIRNMWEEIHGLNIFNSVVNKNPKKRKSVADIIDEFSYKEEKTYSDLTFEYCVNKFIDVSTNFQEIKPEKFILPPLPKRTIDSFEIKNNLVSGVVNIIQDPNSYPNDLKLDVYIYFKLNGKQFESFQRVSIYKVKYEMIYKIFEESVKAQIVNLLSNNMKPIIENEMIRTIDLRNLIQQ